MPFPDYDAINLKDYYFDTSGWHNPKNIPINVPVPILTSRSCPNQCTFCSMFLLHGKGWRYRSAKNVVDEIEQIYNKYNHRYFSFMDDNMTLLKGRTLEIMHEIIERGLNIQFDTPNGLSLKTLDKEVMDSLVKAGLIRLCVAPENGSEYIRNKLMQKNMTEKQIYDFFELIKDYDNLFVKAFFIIGYPEETKETLEENYKMIEKIVPTISQVSVFNLVPFPGTKIFEDCMENGLLTFPREELHNLKTFSNYNESDEPFIKPYKLEKKDLMDFRERVSELVKHRKKVIS
ncbi:B12-binding domain-containing radical SAM protein [archaeon]|nr:B12-binding domain-containing radical SAM protein [archaeon]MBT4242208.1 B12-binding domain-containing radical SAM protein [archaeon]MBT4417896.1 B12-binding domain-containing radical SAM protein [archaeon]